MTKSVLALVVLAATGFSAAALAATTAPSTKAAAAIKSKIVVAQSTNNGVRDQGEGGGRNDVGQQKGQGKKGQ
jgi:opacity protein-like surface antigen